MERVQILKTKGVIRFSRHERIRDASLREAIGRAERGLVDADLGGGLMKQRVARQGQGKSGGYRTIVAYRKQDRAIFLYAFAKNERENISAEELDSLRILGANWLNATSHQIARAIEEGILQEIHYDEETEPKA
jgi:hypothetical protein